MDYNDSVLMRSSLEAAKESFIDVTVEAIEKRIVNSQGAMAACETGVRVITGMALTPDDSLDDVGTTIKNIVHMSLQILTDLQGPVSACQQHNLVIRNATRLQIEIKKWRDFEDAIVKPWPWKIEAESRLIRR
jgi:hypothetical protein